MTFGVGIVLSLSANITAAPQSSLFAVMVTGCPPVALLLLIELLNHVLTHHRAETTGEKIDEHDPSTEDHDGLPATRLLATSGDPRPRTEPTHRTHAPNPRSNRRYGRTGSRSGLRATPRPVPS